MKSRAESAKFGPEFGRRMQELLGSEADFARFVEASQEIQKRPHKSLRLNSLRNISPAQLEAAGVRLLGSLPWLARGFWADHQALQPLESHPVLGAGWVYLQEASAMEPVVLLDVKPGQRVLDLCAAPGGKATQIGEDLAGEGWLVSNEPVRGRAERLQAQLARHGVLNTSIFALDPTTLAARLPRYFDRVLVDAPCSGESLFSKRKELRGDVRDTDVLGCSRRQFVILDRAAAMLKAGGRLVYSTSTYSREENESIIEAFLVANTDFKLIQQQRRWPHIDQVPGGYIAVLERAGSLSDEGFDLDPVLRDSQHGALRHGPFMWNGEVDRYALEMAAHPLVPAAQERLADFFSAPASDELPPAPRLAVDLAAARAYLNGQALPASGLETGLKGLRTVEWQGYPLGLAKSVENRFNNLLPKILRGLA